MYYMMCIIVLYVLANMTITEFVEYLKIVKHDFVNNIASYDDIHIVIGNESCDLDSTVSPLGLAYLLHHHKIPEISSNALVIPLISVSYEDFLLRRENCLVLEDQGIPLDYLIYRNELTTELLKSKKVTVSLVDHHVLSDDDILKSNVVQIIDHRPVDPSSNWNEEKVSIKINAVGSCSTLIAEDILKTDSHLLNEKLGYLIYATIVFDTVALAPENGRAKELDYEVSEKLKHMFTFKESVRVIYDKLWVAHNDVAHLTPKQLLSKDLKIVETIPVPGLPMLVENFLHSIKNSYQAIENFADEYKVTLLVLIGLGFDTDKKTLRDVAIFWKNGCGKLKDVLICKLKKSEELKGYNFCFTEVKTPYDNIVCLKQNNIKLSRKHIIPIVKDAVLESAEFSK